MLFQQCRVPFYQVLFHFSVVRDELRERLCSLFLERGRNPRRVHWNEAQDRANALERLE